MSSITILDNDTALDLRVRVKQHDKRSTPGAKKVDQRMVVEAIVSLGYPIGRYLRNIEDSEKNGTRELSKIYARMRVVYYQNRNEFLRLRPILVKKLEGVGAPALKSMAALSQEFSPMWMIGEQAESVLKLLKRFC